MFSRFLITVFLISSMFIYACSSADKKTGESIPELSVLAVEPYFSSSFWQNLEVFETGYNCSVSVKLFTDAAQLLDYLSTETGSLKADVVCGIPVSMSEEFLALNVFARQDSSIFLKLNEEYMYDKTGFLLPYAFAFLCLAYDTRYINDPPQNLGKLQDNRWANDLLMPDPQKTALGKSMLHYSAERFGKNGFRYLWKGIEKNIHYYSPSYDDALRRFLAAEAHLLPSLDTYVLYHQRNDGEKYVQYIILDEGTYRYTEQAAITSTGSKKELARKFLSFLLTPQFQKRIWEEKYMYPVRFGLLQDTDLENSVAAMNAISCNPNQEKVREEESLWLRKIERTLNR